MIHEIKTRGLRWAGHVQRKGVVPTIIGDQSLEEKEKTERNEGTD